MSYFKDLSKYNYLSDCDESLNIGWLDNIHPFTKGEVSETFLEQLWKFCHFPVNIARGFHTCEICKTYEEYSTDRQIPAITYKQERLSAGYHEIRVFSEDLQTIYAAPTLIWHYITEHHYQPPKEFIEAVIKGPQPGSEHYLELLEPFTDEIQKKVYWTALTST
jgi:hypothetical protein